MQLISDRESRLDLDKNLKKIFAVFDPEPYIKAQNFNNEVINYYTESRLFYKLFHSSAGAIHMALCDNDIFSNKGFYQQAQRVAKTIQPRADDRILELGCGTGFSSLYLAKLYPEAHFTGMDFTPVHIEEANRKARRSSLDNINFENVDFHHLPTSQETFDHAFIVEALCHANNIGKVLENVYRNLRQRGTFSIFDGFRKIPNDRLSENERLAALLVEKTMAVGHEFMLIDEFLKLVESKQFIIKSKVDLSEKIVPNINRLQFFARGYYKSPRLAKALKPLLPNYLLQNTIAGLLMPTVVHRGIHGYFQVVLEKA